MYRIWLGILDGINHTGGVYFSMDITETRSEGVNWSHLVSQRVQWTDRTVRELCSNSQTATNILTS